ncbi:alpha/beta fold hydrolase [Sphingomonas oleivorans]|nr:alpha/beta fold hydrolase [Sphingomonas oleivorans]
MRAALKGLRAYQNAPRPPRPPAMPVVAEAGRARLRDYGGEGPPIVFVPSLINPPNVLDLTPEKSLLRWLATQGVRPLLVDWGDPGAEDRNMSVAGHVEQLLLPMLDALGEPATLAGYCVGGTMALAAAARAPVRSLVLLATPWHFSGFPEGARSFLADLWERAAPLADHLGLLPIEVLQTSFWQLDRTRTIAKFEGFSTVDPDSDTARGFVALEDWASDGPPLTYAAGRELIEDFFTADLPGRSEWQVGGAPVDPAALSCPVLNIISSKDRIVPAASAPQLGERKMLDLGHVGMVVGSRARTSLWEPLAHWLLRS